MKKIILLTLFMVLILPESKAQVYADKKYYLIDSLDLKLLKESDIQVLDSCLKAYHAHKNDTSKLNTLGKIVSDVSDEIINSKYNVYRYNYAKSAYKNEKNKEFGSKIKEHEAEALIVFAKENETTGNNEIAITYYKKALAIYLDYKNKKDEAYIYNRIGLVYDNMGDFKSAIVFFLKSLDLYKSLNIISEIATVLNNIGITYLNIGDSHSALKCHFEALEIREKIKDMSGLSNTYTNIGAIYFNQNETQKALTFFQKSYEIDKKNNFINEQALDLNNIAAVYNYNKDFTNAIRIFRQAYLLYEKTSNYYGMGMCLNNLGGNLCSVDSCTEGMKCLKKSLEIFKRIDNKIWIAYTYNKIGRNFLKLKQIDSAYKYCSLGYEVSVKIGHVDNIKRASEDLSKIYTEKGKGMEALEMYKLSIKMRDSIDNINNKQAAIEMQTKYEYDKQKVLDDVKNEKLLAIEKEKQQNQFRISILSMFSVVVVLVLLIIIYRRLKITNQQKIIIEETNEALNKTNEEIASKNHEIMQSITYAKRLQQSILPPPRLVKEYMKDSFVLYMPKDIVAGDFYWIESYNNKIYFAAADCTGHGVPGAMVSMVCHNALNRALLEFNLLSPSLILDKASELVDDTFSKSEDNVQDGMDVSLYCLDTATLQLEWAGANNPLWMIQNGEFKEIKADKQPVGRYENRKPFTNHVLQLNEGDSLFSITDGYPDQFGGDQGKKYTYKKLREFLIKINDKPMALQKDELIAEFDKWKSGHDQVDDVCIIGVKV